MNKIIAIVVALVVFTVFSIVYYKNTFTPKIALIPVKGVISNYHDTLVLLNMARKDPSIKAVVLDVDSPGGAVGASQEIYRAIEKLRKKKPVVVSMGNVAASGGYYISAAANKIFANPGTITGSIGVIVQHIDATKLLDKIGIKVENIKSGKNKDILYPNHKLTPEQKKLIEQTVKDVYEQFLDAIVKYRPITKEELRPYADGRIFSGRQAKKLKLVDELGNLQDAIAYTRKSLGKVGKEAVVIKLEKRQPLFEKFFGTKLNINLDASSGLYYLMSF